MWMFMIWEIVIEIFIDISMGDGSYLGEKKDEQGHDQSSFD